LLALSTTGWWTLGYAVGAAAVVVAAALVILVIALARRIVTQAREIETALVGAHANTEALFDIAMMNHALESITRGVKQVKGEQGPQDERRFLSKLASRVLPWGQP
jgi:hypothetical protein